jgi:hypothetical protein
MWGMDKIFWLPPPPPPQKEENLIHITLDVLLSI